MGTERANFMCLIRMTNYFVHFRDPVAGEADSAVFVRHDDRNSGLLAPLVRVLFKSAIEEGFVRMSADLARHLQHAQPASST